MTINHSTIQSVKLNNFIHRIDCKVAITKIVQQHGGNLKRIRRSRNWQITGTDKQLTVLAEKLRAHGAKWVADAIEKALPNPTINFAHVLRDNPAITVNALMAKSGCTLTEARTAIDDAENFT
ncbi:hypothetical protein CW745_04995 [Psychromonas sp. psych-6C06]|uniref:ribosome recycling factor family protein n=1 Tax=Psychromonas sp. psych-6C06 TaxID=2058089 RepID=UPI000C3202E2|nr:ribosome recycling factor family protein [Psychromonas sp. psych-6C06]PKF62781.1 hypothetical protein CW745_04995 [Psychromonas sp. psych-6C06]